MAFTLHPQLLADCHQLGDLGRSHLLLHKNAALPWFILVPEVDHADLLDVPDPERSEIVTECTQVARFVRDDLGWPKTNFASIGNVVPQLHLHVVGRREGDACWPRPVWGNLQESTGYGEATLSQWCEQLAKNYGLKLS